MIKKFISFFSVVAIFIQMLIGGYPIFGGKTVELTDFEVSVSVSENLQTYTFSKPDKTSFNKFTLFYDSDTYIHGEITYIYKHKTYSEKFYMEKGTNQSYTSFIDGYLEYGCGKKISKITFKTVDGENGSFELKRVKTEVAEVYEDVVFIENDSYKLGASLLWGGAISYLEDFNDSSSEYSNLVNCHDTGRLIQQSYYGTSKPPYEPGEAFGHTWPYNPVQGGNKYNQNSKIIDIKVDGDSLYIKGVAREWAKEEFTYCYMENTYTLFENHIKVDNRFVDYSPFEHPVTSQECPALYTVSALGNFVYYDGTQSWTDDVLTYRDDLGFWGDPNEPQVNKYYQSADSESWSAWVNDADWGIGLYAPGVYAIKSGRYEYTGTKDATEGPTNYVAPLGRFAIVRCQPTAYSYFITTGTTGEMRGFFKSVKDTVSNNIFG